MFGTILPALVVFGAMFVVSVIGYAQSNARAKRLHAASWHPDAFAAARPDTMAYTRTVHR